MEITIAIIIAIVGIGIYLIRRESSSSPTVSPTPSVTPSATPVATPNPSGTDPLDVYVDTSSVGFVSSCALGTTTVPALECSLTISGGSGNYSITSGECYSTASNMCQITSIDVGQTSVTIHFPGTVYTGCPRESGFNDANYDITITDNVTGEVVTETLSVYWEIV